MKISKKYYMYGFPDGRRVTFFTSLTYLKYIEQNYQFGSLYECTFTQLKSNLKDLKSNTNAYIFPTRKKRTFKICIKVMDIQKRWRSV